MQMSSAKRRLSSPAKTFYDIIATQQGGCVDKSRRGAFDRMNIQNVSTSRLYNRL